MSTYTNFSSSSRTYSFVWSKYRPAILKLMVDSNEKAQEYKFSKHEIKSINPNEKGGYSFNLKLHKGKSVNDIRNSAIAKDLLSVLQQSKKALELTETSTYLFELDKHFVLHITKEEEQKEVVIDEPVVEEVAAE